MRRKRADRIKEGDILHNGHLSPLHVIEIGDNSLGDVVLRCAYRPGDNPHTSLLLPPNELVATL